MNAYKKHIFCLITIILITGSAFSQSLPDYLPKNGLVGWWPLDENSNDHSGNLDHGINNNVNLTNDRFGNCNQAYSFDSTDSYIKLDSFKYSSYTYAAWVSLSSVSSDTNRSHTIFILGMISTVRTYL